MVPLGAFPVCPGCCCCALGYRSPYIRDRAFEVERDELTGDLLAFAAQGLLEVEP
ncbi:MAG: hypothetical protein IT382_17100 [Deltaproteobacteria bacterium]|nr:hypothetical protein [Deltaproteobacteria bacterium]